MMTDQIPLDVIPTDDDMLKVCLTIHGMIACCYVSSYHLVECKRKQLKDTILREAVQTYQASVTLSDC